MSDINQILVGSILGDGSLSPLTKRNKSSTLDKRYKYHLNSSIATNCFSFEECNLLSEVLNNNFKLKTSVNKTTMRGKIYPRIYFKSECMIDFIKIIKPYILPVFNYKIGIE